MILRNDDYDSLARKIINENRKIIVYGAGMIGQIIIPYLIDEYGVEHWLTCFVDADKRKQGSQIQVCGSDYPIVTPDYLENIDENHIILITNSNFFPIVQFLDGIRNLDKIEGYIIPMMQIRKLNKSKSIVLNRKKEVAVIPKKIHYCWFGRGKIPDFLRNCIQSWERNCPDYEIIRWNEDNYDINKHSYVEEAYKHKKYGFVSDYARLDILYEHGGIYLDTDVFLEKNLDDLLYQDGFVGVEKWGNINTGGGCGFIKEHPILKKMIEYRDSFHFELPDGSLNIETNGLYETKVFLEEGFKPCNELQEVADVTVYPSYIHHPYDYMSCETSRRETTVSVHYFYGGWMAENQKINRENTQNKYNDVLRRIGMD